MVRGVRLLLLARVLSGLACAAVVAGLQARATAAAPGSGDPRPSPWLKAPAGSVLVECEELAECGWHVYPDETASGGRKILANRPEWRAAGEVRLPPGRYTVWVRSQDNGRYPGHYHYDLEVEGRTRTMARVEPVGHTWVWERWGEVEGGTVRVLLHRADSFPAAADCILFTPDPDFRPSGRDLIHVRKVMVRRPVRRQSPVVTFVFVAPAPLKPKQRLFAALRDRQEGLLRCEEVPLPQPTERWPVGQPVVVRATLSSLRFYRSGQYRLTAEFTDSEYAGREEGDYSMGTLVLPPGGGAPRCVAAIRRLHGTPTLFVNGKPTFAFAFLGVGTGNYHEFAATGSHLYSMGADLGYAPGGGLDEGAVDLPYLQVLEQDPDAYMLPRIGVGAPAWWAAAHPEELCLLDNGQRSGESFASEAWLRDMAAHLARYVRHVRSAPYGSRVIGFHLCTGVSAEWQSWGLWENRRGDFSRPATVAFREWLRNRYRTTDALRTAWRDPSVTFETAGVPARAERERPGPLLREQQAVNDFFEFYPTPAARAIVTLAAAVKRASRGESLVGVFYGYAPQYGPLAPESQHLALAQVLRSPDVDFLCSPAMYSDRGPLGTSNFMSLTESVQQHGKFWFDEADIRTHLQPDPVGRCATLEETLGVLKREYAHVRARGAGMWWFDMSGGWFSHPRIHALFREMREAGQSALRRRAPRLAPEIAVVLDEQSAYRHHPGPQNWDFYHYGITMQVASLPRVGAPAALHLLSDLPQLRPYRMVLFLNTFDLTEGQRRWIDTHLKRDGRTLVWVYAPGYGRRGDRGGVVEDVAGIRELTGIEVERLEGEGPFRVRVTPSPPWLQGLDAAPEYGSSRDTYGPSGTGSPRFAVADREAEILGRYADGAARPALAQRRFGGWTSVYSAAPGLPPGLVRSLARRAGIHIFSNSGDACYVGRGVVALHARRGGTKEIRLPRPLRVREILTGTDRSASFSTPTERITFHLDEADTRVFEVR